MYRIIRSKLTNEVVYIGSDAEFTESGLITTKSYMPDVNISSHDMIDVDSCPADFEPYHYLYTDDGWVRSSTGRSLMIHQKLSQLAALRYEKETAGIEINGAKIRTDRETQSTLDSTQRKAESNPDLVVDWKGESGWIGLTSPQIIATGNAVFAHVQACFKRERELESLIKEDPEIDINVGWPV